LAKGKREMRTLTPRIACELLAHEGLVREAYRDSQGVWTWSVGITDASGHRVERYRDNPQTLERCLEVYVWLLQRRYLPPVLAAFGRHDPAEHELAAALSFHYNTGAIDGRCLAYEVAKPAYCPVRGKRIDVAASLAALMNGDSTESLQQAPVCAAPLPEPVRRSWFERLFS
jgi:GH24 family phage-related lysozyme (muramidase)